MIDEEHLRTLPLARAPIGQRLLGTVFLGPNYRLPPKTEIVLEGLESIPRDETVIFALNHTDRYNYWPFQFKMWRLGSLPYTTTWVKGKYYGSRLLQWILDRCNTIPLPSKGYLIFADARRAIGRSLENPEYRFLRALVDRSRSQSDPEVDAALSRDHDLERIVRRRRSGFDPESCSYSDHIESWSQRLMKLVEERTLEAMGPLHNNLIVFPQGTRSLRLLPGHTGLVQFALRHRISVVPVGSMGSESIYPGTSPWAQGGCARYRIGRPLTADGAFAPFRIDEAYRPFTRAAARFKERFAGAAAVVTRAIDDLLDEPYKLGDESEGGVHADRFL